LNDLSQFLETLRNRVILSTLVQEKVPLKKRGKTYIGCCPFHNEKTPSFHVDDDKGKYHCFGCGANGDAINYVQERNGFNFIDAVQYLAEKVNLTVPQKTDATRFENSPQNNLYKIMEDATCWMQENLQKTIGVEASHYLERRGILKETIQKFRIGFAPNDYSKLHAFLISKYSLENLQKVGLVYINDKTRTPTDRFRGRIIFPISDQKGRVIAFGGRALDNQTLPKYLNSSDTPLFSKSHILYNHHLARQNLTSNQGYVVVEGYLDVISLYQNGFCSAVAPLGTAVTDDQLNMLWKHQVTPIFCFDGDNAGYNAAIRTAYKALPFLSADKQIHFSILPDGEDPDSLVQKNKDYFDAQLKKKEPLSHFLWTALLKMYHGDTPEALSILKKKADEIINAIKDVNMQQAYTDFFKKQYYVLNNPFTAKVKKKQANQAYDLRTPYQHKKNSLILQKLLLATLLHNPYLISHVHDKVMHLNFDESLNDIVDFLTHYDGILEKNELLSKLKEKISKDALQGLFDPNLMAKAPFIYSKEEEDVMHGWEEIYQQFHKLSNLDIEVKKAKKNLENAFDQDSWQRIKELTNLTLKDEQDYE
jgi:DNA primase